jgi:hypothetical protein
MVNLLVAIGVILFVLWVFGFVTSYTFGGYLHILLVIGVILIVVWLVMYVMGRRR